MPTTKKRPRRTGTRRTNKKTSSKRGNVETTTPERKQFEHPTGISPRVVDLVGLGPTQRAYHAMHHAEYTQRLEAPDEVWTLNKGIRTIKSDLAFILDDIEGECRKSARYQTDIVGYASDHPVIVSEIDHECRERIPSYSNLFEFPLWEIVDHIGAQVAAMRGHDIDDPNMIRQIGLENGYYWHNSIPMILAYAWHVGVQEIRLFGIDYDWPGHSRLEADKPNAEYWVGFLRASGVRVRVPDETTLLNTTRQPWIYGYARQPLS